MRRLVSLILFFLVFSTLAEAQQFAKTGLVSLSRIYDKFYAQSQGVREFQALKASIQSDIARFQDEIQSLIAQRNTDQAQGNTVDAQNLDNEIQQKNAALANFIKTKQAELVQKSNEVKKDDSFQKLLISEIGQEAVSKGFSMILNIEKDSSVVWYSPDADITDGVIARLGVDLASSSVPAPVAPQPPVATPAAPKS